MITFLLFTSIAWLATASLAKILFISIQHGQWLDRLLNWQERLHKWDLQGRELLVKTGGMCELCFSHAVSFFSFWVYVFFMNMVVDCWIVENINSILIASMSNIVWYLVYVSIGANLSLYFITKLFQR